LKFCVYFFFYFGKEYLYILAFIDSPSKNLAKYNFFSSFLGGGCQVKQPNLTRSVKFHLLPHHKTQQEVSELNIMQEEEALVGLDVGGTYFRTTAKPRSDLSKYLHYNSVAYYFN
jgi:hypothetical protein